MSQEMIFKYLAGMLAFLLAFLFRRIFARLDDLDKQQQEDRQKQDERYQGVLVSLTGIDLLKHAVEELSQQIHTMNERLEKLMEKVK